jgi:hypothetical protein
VSQNKEAVTIALSGDMITKCRNYLIAYIWQLDIDISGERGSDEMSKLVTQFRQVQIQSLSWVRYRYEIREEKKATSLEASLIERMSSGARRICSTWSGAEAIIIQWVIVGILKIDPRYWEFSIRFK